MSNVPLFDMTRLLAPVRQELQAAFDRCLDHGQFVLGPEVQKFEAQLAQYIGSAHAVGLSSGTDSLLATFQALEREAGGLVPLQPGDEVLCPSFTFIASATSILRAGYKPVLVDLPPPSQPGSRFNPSVAELERAWTPRTRAVLIVHLFGEAQELGEVAKLCHDRGAVLIEDCAQAIGARFADGRHVGRWGLAGTFSFFPAKNLGALGDGGAVLTDDPGLHQRVREKRQHGCAVRYQFEHLGGNFRLDALQAAFLGVLLPQLDGWVSLRRKHAHLYHQALGPIAAAHPDRLVLPPDAPGHAWNQFVIRSSERDTLKKALETAGIGTAVYYPAGLHRQGALDAVGPHAPLPQTDRACQEVLALPIYPGLQPEEQLRVIEVIARHLGQG